MRASLLTLLLYSAGCTTNITAAEFANRYHAGLWTVQPWQWIDGQCAVTPGVSRDPILFEAEVGSAVVLHMAYEGIQTQCASAASSQPRDYDCELASYAVGTDALVSLAFTDETSATDEKVTLVFIEQRDGEDLCTLVTDATR